MKINWKINVHARKFPLPYLTFAIFGIITYPFYYYLWKYTAPQGYENLHLRLIAVFLCVILALKNYWPKKCKLFLPTFWYLTIVYSLPFLFTFLLLKNNMSYTWAMNGLTVLILLILLLDLASLYIVLTIGISLGILFFIMDGQTFHLPPYSMIIFMTYGSVLVFGSIFSYRKDQIQDREMRLAAEAADRSKSEFIVNISHDIRTPLTGIINLSEYLKNNLELSEEKKYAVAIYQSADQLLKLLNGVLDVITVDTATDDTVHCKPFNLIKLIDSLIELERPAVASQQLEFFYFIDENLPVTVISDRMKLHRILLNLLGNAIKFTPKGSIELRISLLSKKTNTACIQFTVKDTGIGIPKGMQDKVFDRLYKVSPYHKKNIGNGIGLHIVQRYVKLLGGEICFSSEEKKGTTFSFILTLQICKNPKDNSNDTVYKALIQQEKNETHIEEETLNSEVLITDNSAPRPNILLVEDNSLALMALKVQMKPYNVTLNETTDGESALELIKKHSFDLIITDIGLPGISGCELVKRVRLFEKDKALKPVIIYGLTGHSLDSAISKHCMDAGINRIIQKPITAECLKEIMLPFL